MESSSAILLKNASVTIQDPEIDLIDRLTSATAEAGMRVERIDIANIYVALKHRPMAILTSPAGRGKRAFLQFLANTLAGSNGLRRQIMPGHAWYAGGNPANTTLVSMHSRLITEKLFFIVEEALQPQNAQQVFIVGLTQISPAELLSFFTELAGQVKHKEIMRAGDVHLSAPVQFPSNLLLIGTMDTNGFDFWDEDLLSGATVIEWRADVVDSQMTSSTDCPNLGPVYLRSSIRDGWKAYEKLSTVTASAKQPLKTVMLIRRILQTYGLDFTPGMLDEVVLYMANAWSVKGNGLFDSLSDRNLAIATDLVLAQLVLPRYLEAIRLSRTLQADLYTVLDGHFPHCIGLLGWHSRQNDPLTSKGTSNKI